MIKLLYIFSTLENCGPIKVHFDIISNLPKTQFDIQIITLSAEPEKSLIGFFNKIGISVTCLNLDRKTWLFKGITDIQSYILSYKPDIVHTQGIRADILSALFLNHPVKFSTLHNFPYQEYTFTYGKVKGRIMGFLHFQALKRLNYPIVASKSNQTQIFNAINLKFKYILNGIEASLFTAVSKEAKNALRQQLGLPLDKVLFIYVGQLTARKDPLMVIRAFLNASISNACLLMLGEGDLQQQCKLAASGNSNISIMGFKENVSDYVKASDYYISASKAEGLPLSVLEALGSGLPVILSDIMPHEEIISFNPKAGYIFATGSELSLVSSLQAIVKDNYDFMAAEASNIVKQHLNAKVMSEAYQKIYLKSISEKNG